MANEIRLPDIGDFKDVPIIEILVATGRSVRKDETILTLESDKASMDVPAPEDGVIGEIRVKVGDKVTQGDLLATYSEGGDTRQAAAPKGAAPAADARGGGFEIQEPAPKATRPAEPPPRAVRLISRRIFWFWEPVPAGTPPHSAPPISDRTSFWSTRGRRSAASASMSAASPPRRCCMSPRSSTTPRPWVRTA
jgi:pyruvate/2-oxoglutarate dehydrogenase complex dihydrolipoamide acyltransferase (E2) component